MASFGDSIKTDKFIEAHAEKLVSGLFKKSALFTFMNARLVDIKPFQEEDRQFPVNSDGMW